MENNQRGIYGSGDILARLYDQATQIIDKSLRDNPLCHIMTSRASHVSFPEMSIYFAKTL
jgi:hypothetical protein